MKRSIENIVKHSEVSEKEIEKYLCKRTKEIGLLCLKYSNPNAVGYPDRLVVLPACLVVWVELKSKGRKPTKIQQVRHEELLKLDHVIWVIDSKETVDELITELQKFLSEYKEEVESKNNNQV